MVAFGLRMNLLRLFNFTLSWILPTLALVHMFNTVELFKEFEEGLVEMRVFLVLSIFCFGALVSSNVHAYQGMEKDFATCTQGSGKVSNKQIVKACTQLIDNAAKHNSLTGYFFALRAIANTDKASNCLDARQAMKLLDNPKLIQHTKELIKINC